MPRGVPWGLVPHVRNRPFPGYPNPLLKCSVYVALTYIPVGGLFLGSVTEEVDSSPQSSGITTGEPATSYGSGYMTTLRIHDYTREQRLFRSDRTPRMRSWNWRGGEISLSSHQAVAQVGTDAASGGAVQRLATLREGVRGSGAGGGVGVGRRETRAASHHPDRIVLAFAVGRPGVASWRAVGACDGAGATRCWTAPRLDSARLRDGEERRDCTAQT